MANDGETKVEKRSIRALLPEGQGEAELEAAYDRWISSLADHPEVFERSAGGPRVAF